MARKILATHCKPLLYALGAGMWLTGCAIVPPVQEMSDARQAIRAAEEANAREHAPGNLHQAETLLDQATRSLDRGAYDEARHEAVAAREQAIQARALSTPKIASQPTDFR